MTLLETMHPPPKPRGPGPDRPRQLPTWIAISGFVPCTGNAMVGMFAVDVSEKSKVADVHSTC